MSRHIKLLSVMMAAVMGLSAVSTAAVFAEGDVSVVEPAAPDIPEEPQPGPDVPDFTEGPIAEPEDPDIPDTPYYPPDDDGNSGSGGGSQSGGGGQSSWGGNSGGGVERSEGNEFNYNNYSNTETFYVGGGQTYIPPKATAPSAALYNSDKKTIDDKELNRNDWGDIASRLKNTGNSPAAEDDSSGDFNFIQKNTAKEDNGHWIIISGVLCLLLSVTGFIYLIASAISRRRRLRMPAGNSLQGNYRADDDYDDGYQGGSKKPKNGKRYK